MRCADEPAWIFGGGTLDGGTNAAFVLKLDANGNHLWIGGGPLLGARGYDTFVAKFDAGGEHV